MSSNRIRISLSRVNFAAPCVFNRRSDRESTRRMAWALPMVCCALLCLFSLPYSALAQDNFKHTQNTADSSLRGDLQVDPSTLGMTHLAVAAMADDAPAIRDK